MSANEAAAGIGRINIDVTETLSTGKWTGIERVVRRLSAELAAVSPEKPEIRLVAAMSGHFHALNAAGLERFLRPAGGGGQGGGGGRVTRAAVAFLVHFPALLRLVQSIKRERELAPVLPGLIEAERADFGPGDQVLLLDSYWSGTSAIVAAGHARRAGASVVSAIYDLIPITHPHYMMPSLVSAFPGKTLEALRISDGAIAISKYSADELRRWLGTRLPGLPIRWFHLGNDPGAAPQDSAHAFGRNYTMIGTIEPRKGHALVVDAFERRWAAGDDCRLTMVGKIGWAEPELVARLAALKGEGRLRLIHDADDAQLAAILAETDAVIMASKIEGFGLPIVEALALDIPVIASDIPIFREIGGDTILAFDVDDSTSLVAAMERFEANPEEYRARARAFAWPSWNAAAHQMLGVLGELYRARG
jgi:glycosyltransferase involved in cell wall biosynthesis